MIDLRDALERYRMCMVQAQTAALMDLSETAEAWRKESLVASATACNAYLKLENRSSSGPRSKDESHAEQPAGKEESRGR